MPHDIPPFIPPDIPKNKSEKIPRGRPATSDRMAVFTVRLSKEVRNRMHLLYRSDPDQFDSVSHLVQLAIAEFLTKRGL